MQVTDMSDVESCFDDKRRNAIPDGFRRAVGKFGGRIAITFRERSWTFQELDRAVGRVACALIERGLKKGDRIVANGRNSDTYLILWLACTRAGIIHVPTNYALTAAELRYIVEQCGARAIVSDPHLSAVVQQACRDTSVFLAGKFEDGDRGSFDILAIASDRSAPLLEESHATDVDIAQILYTSGTTGTPKGAAMSHRSLMSEYNGCVIELQFAPSDIALAALPLYHTAQMHSFTTPQLLVGATTHIVEGPDPDIVLPFIERAKINSIWTTPTNVVRMLRHPKFEKYDLSSLRNLYYGASIMPEPVLAELRLRIPGIRPFNCYGQSETGPNVSVLKPEEHDARPTSIGRPNLSVETRIVDSSMNDVPCGVHGEIVHRTPQLMTCYWDKPDETCQAFEGGWFHSGDVGYFDEEGYLFLVDRIKDIIKTGGVIVASREVEDVLFTHNAVAEVAVFGLPDPDWIEIVTAAVILRTGETVTEEELRLFARKSLAPFKVPKRILFVDDLPRNTAGKILKRELRQLAIPA